MATDLDPRVNVVRPDLASLNLKGKVNASRFAEGRTHWVIKPSAPVRKEPRFDAPLDTEALYGEPVDVYDEREGWAWVQLRRDHYVGYLPVDSLSLAPIETTHYVSAIRTFLFPAPDIKQPPLMALPLMARIEASGEQGDFLQLKQGGFIHRAHIRVKGDFEKDFVTVAEHFLESPYLWGGRQSTGIDCSGLVQISLAATGRKAPRDSDMQCAALGDALPNTADRASLKRGDLVFWKGHVGIMQDGKNLLHANAHHMKTAVEPLDVAATRIAASGSQITAIRRLSGETT